MCLLPKTIGTRQTVIFTTLFIIKKNMIALTKKLWFNLFFCEQKEKSLYQKKLKLSQKTNNKSKTKSEKKISQNNRNQFVKCFNYDKIDHFTKNCRSIKKNKTFVNITNKKDSQSFHKAYEFLKKKTSQNRQRRSLQRLTLLRRRLYIKYTDFLSWIFLKKMFYEWWCIL